MRSEGRRMVTYVGTAVAFLVALFAIVYIITNVFKIVPVQFTQIIMPNSNFYFLTAL